MNKFLGKIVILCAPLFAWSVFVVLVDPFSYFNISRAIPADVKERTALGLNDLMYKTIAFRNKPCENILSGDSRIGDLPLGEIKNISGAQYKLLNSDGAKLNEIFDLIYFANSQVKLRNVVIGISINLFNEYGYADRVTNINDVLHNPFLYLFNKNVAQACFYTVRGTIFGKRVTSMPPMTKEEFWKWNLNIRGFYWYGKYKFPEKLFHDLLRLDLFAERNKIKLTFIILPQHIEFHHKLVEYGLAEDEKNFKEIMSRLQATVIDYDFENSITTNKTNYDDPVHFNHDIGNVIVHEIWSNHFTIGRKL